MKRFAALFTLLLSAVLLSGCPYESKVPLGTATEYPVDERLFGRWQQTGGDDEERGELSFLSAGDHEYRVIIHDEENSLTLRAYRTVVEGVDILSFHEINDENRGPVLYSFVKYEFNDGKLKLSIVEDTLLPEGIVSSQKLRSLIASYINKAELFDSLIMLKKIAD